MWEPIKYVFCHKNRSNDFGNFEDNLFYSPKDFKKESSGKVLRTFEFLHIFGAAQKIQAKV